MILDTNFLIAIGQQDGGAIEKAKALEEARVPLRVPTMTVYELYLSVGKGAYSDENKRQIEAVLGNRPLLEVTEAVAKQAGIVEGELQASDSKSAIGPVDAIVAAMGLEYNEPVVTDDVEDFGQVEELTVESF
jgi:predicted nucleic acid-binding protein